MQKQEQLTSEECSILKQFYKNAQISGFIFLLVAGSLTSVFIGALTMRYNSDKIFIIPFILAALSVLWYFPVKAFRNAIGLKKDLTTTTKTIVKGTLQAISGNYSLLTSTITYTVDGKEFTVIPTVESGNKYAFISSLRTVEGMLVKPVELHFSATRNLLLRAIYCDVNPSRIEQIPVTENDTVIFKNDYKKTRNQFLLLGCIILGFILIVAIITMYLDMRQNSLSESLEKDGKAIFSFGIFLLGIYSLIMFAWWRINRQILKMQVKQVIIGNVSEILYTKQRVANSRTYTTATYSNTYCRIGNALYAIGESNEITLNQKLKLTFATKQRGKMGKLLSKEKIF